VRLLERVTIENAWKSHLGTGQNNLARDKDEQDYFGLVHAVDQAREELYIASTNITEQCQSTHLRLVRREISVGIGQALQSNGKLDIARSDNVLDLKVLELGVEAELLDDAGVLASGQSRVVLRFGACHNHLARSKDEGGRLGFSNPHNDSGKALHCVSPSCYQKCLINEHLWVILGVASMQSASRERQR
jgi:hypothetical protein